MSTKIGQVPAPNSSLQNNSARAPVVSSIGIQKEIESQIKVLNKNIADYQKELVKLNSQRVRILPNTRAFNTVIKNAALADLQGIDQQVSAISQKILAAQTQLQALRDGNKPKSESKEAKSPREEKKLSKQKNEEKKLTFTPEQIFAQLVQGGHANPTKKTK